MDHVNQIIRPKAPVGLRPEILLVPGRATQKRMAVFLGDQSEFTPLRSEETVDMGGMHAGIERQFLHRRGLADHVECQSLVLLSCSDGLDKRPGGEFAVVQCALTAALEARAERIRDA